MTMVEDESMAIDYTLVIGDKNLSSWSLRPWLAMKQCGIPFAEECIRLRQPDSKAEILRRSPSGKVPALKTGTGVVWDSLAILDYLAERHPERNLWPEDDAARVMARSISAEMHSGFAALRNDMSMDLLSKLPAPPISAALEADIRRIAAIWQEARARFGRGGPFLFGLFSVLPMPCTRRWRRGSAPMAWISPDLATAARGAATRQPSWRCRPWPNGPKARRGR
jgi:glutathione S-transferase